MMFNNFSVSSFMRSYLELGKTDGLQAEKIVSQFFYSEAKKMDIEIVNTKYFAN